MKRISYGRMLTTKEVIDLIDRMIREQRSFSLVRVGDGENLVMAQKHVMPIKDVLKTRWGRRSRTTKTKGIHLPNEKARDKLIRAVKQADLVGIPYHEDNELRAPQKYLRELTDKCFRKYKIRPKKHCHTLVNRHLVEHPQFWEMLTGRKVVLISKWADSFADLIKEQYPQFNIHIAAKIPFSEYSEIEQTVRRMKDITCDVVLISAGVNAVILAEKLARKQGRIAIDFGKTAMFMVKGRTDRIRPWRDRRSS